MKRNKLSLQLLDEYARTLTRSQVKRLYEAKTTKKYNKALFEAYSDNTVNPYEFWIDNYTIDEFNLPDPYIIKEQIANYIPEEDFIEMVVSDDGLAMRTADADTYELIIEAITELYPEIPSDVINNNIDQRYLREN